MKRICKNGIYKIQSKLFPDKIYIGSSKDINARFKRHTESLTGKRSHFNSIKLIKIHVDKYGIDDITFSIIKLCPIENLVYWEQYYISELNPYFNTEVFAAPYNHKAKIAMNTAITDINDECISYLVSREKKIRSLCDRKLFPETIFSL